MWLFNLMRRRWRATGTILLVSALLVWMSVELALPDDCASKYRRVKVGMQESEVHAIMGRRNILLPLIIKGDRIRRAAGVTSVWTEEWYERGDKLTGVHFRWDKEGKLAAKAIWIDGAWLPTTE